MKMAENRLCDKSSAKEMVCIDTYRVLDSCRDKDCFEDVRVYLTCYGQEIIERTCAVRAKSAKVLWSYIDIDAVPFNRGFYQLTIKIFTKIVCEACIGPANIQEFEGIAVVEKKVILFGSEGNVSVFKSEKGCSGFCPPADGRGKCKSSTNLPIAVLETVDPIILSSKVVEPRHPCCCPCTVDDIPEGVGCCIEASLCDSDTSNKLLISLGFFSVVRIERPAQYLINAAEYSVPKKECAVPTEDDPCSLFRNMSFPVSEFSPPSISGYTEKYEGGASSSCSCGCDK